MDKFRLLQLNIYIIFVSAVLVIAALLILCGLSINKCNLIEDNYFRTTIILITRIFLIGGCGQFKYIFAFPDKLIDDTRYMNGNT